eukprot:CAMPEP_0117686244 /NCGR_PEP_ID=MMETSP0804-20121206/22317_1 /TAXON_ID=1074897 /ORGANISM="Tetraselmis astigmatica, Strain CCMP880" /LENGTH=58 /DNA_ID=CAMNT_0005497865 /DNA_START=913 /DNA_END=1089 /DNA_ORIENTATION=-
MSRGCSSGCPQAKQQILLQVAEVAAVFMDRLAEQALAAVCRSRKLATAAFTPGGKEGN